MIPVRKALRLCKVLFKMLLIRANTIKRIVQTSHMTSDAGNPGLCNIAWVSHAMIRVQHSMQITSVKGLS